MSLGKSMAFLDFLILLVGLRWLCWLVTGLPEPISGKCNFQLVGHINRLYMIEGLLMEWVFNPFERNIDQFENFF